MSNPRTYYQPKQGDTAAIVAEGYDDNFKTLDASKADAQATAEALAGKVDKTDGKDLMTAAERDKLTGIETGANAYTHPESHPADMIDDTAEKVMMTASEREKLSGIETGANAYTLPKASPVVLGGIKLGNNLTMRADGTVDAAGGSGGSPTYVIDMGLTDNAERITALNVFLTAYRANPNVQVRLSIEGVSVLAIANCVDGVLMITGALDLPQDTIPLKGPIQTTSLFIMAAVTENEVAVIVSWGSVESDPHRVVSMGNVMNALTEQAQVSLLNSVIPDLYETLSTGKTVLQVRIYDYTVPASYYFNGPSVVISASHITPETGSAVFHYFAVRATLTKPGQSGTVPTVGSVQEWIYSSKQL